jgi:serine/threonine-protein kinase
VLLVVSSGVEQVTVPNVVGETEAAARDALRELRVSVIYQDLPAGDSDDGLVLAQSPRAGTEVAAGSSIRLTVGRGAVIG